MRVGYPSWNKPHIVSMDVHQGFRTTLKTLSNCRRSVILDKRRRNIYTEEGVFSQLLCLAEVDWFLYCDADLHAYGKDQY